MRNIKGVFAHTSFIGNSGYASHSRNFFTNLYKYIPVKVHNFSIGKNWQGVSVADPHKDEPYITNTHKEMLSIQACMNAPGKLTDFDIYGGLGVDVSQYVNIVLNETLHHFYYKDYEGFNIAYNVWESTEQPPAFFKRLLEFDQLWVPTNWQRDCSIAQGYPSERVFVVPEAVDSTIFNLGPPVNRSTDGRFKFLLFGRWDHRKSTTEIIKAFLETFDKSEPVDLICSIDNPYPVDGMKSTQERLESFGFNDSRLKIKSFLTGDEYINYLKSGHVLLTCSRSEGWNLPLIEAIACGTPTICSSHPAQLEFAEGISHKVRTKEQLPMKPFMFAPEGSGLWDEPDFEHLKEVMRDVYRNYNAYKKKAVLDAPAVMEAFTWDNAAKKAHNILKNIDHSVKYYNGTALKTCVSNKQVLFRTSGHREQEIKLSFKNSDTKKSLYETTLGGNHWATVGNAKNISTIAKVAAQEYEWKSDIECGTTTEQDITIKPNTIVEKDITSKEVFVLSTDEGYWEYAKLCIDGLLNFSNKEIIVYAINCSLVHDNPRVHVRPLNFDMSWNVEGLSNPGHYYARIASAVDCVKQSSDTTFMFVDADMIIGKDIDKLWEHKELLEDYPLCMQYYAPAWHQWKIINDIKYRSQYGQETSKILNEGVTRNTGFIAACGFFMFDITSVDFLEEVLSIYSNNKNGFPWYTKDISGANIFVDDNALSEERAINYLMWKHNKKNVMPVTWNSPNETPLKNSLGESLLLALDAGDFSIVYDTKNNYFYGAHPEPGDGKQLTYSIEANKHMTPNLVKNLMIVAHPDDESIFGAGLILEDPTSWKIISMTGATDSTRVNEFMDAVKELGVEKAEVWSNTDSLTEEFDPQIASELKAEFSKGYEKIVTHGSDGEYGHVQHKSLHNIIKNINPNNLHFFALGDTPLSEDIYAKKQLVLEHYKSQVTDLPGFHEYLRYEKIVSAVKKREAIAIGSYADTTLKQDILIKAIENAKQTNLPIILVSHYPLPANIQEQVDHYLYDANNVLTEKDPFYMYHWFTNSELSVVSCLPVPSYHAVSIWNSWVNLANYTENRFDLVHYVESDTVVDWAGYFSTISNKIGQYAVLGMKMHNSNNSIFTNLISFNPQWWEKHTNYMDDWETYKRKDQEQAKKLGEEDSLIFEAWLFNYFKAEGVFKDICLQQAIQPFILERNLVERNSMSRALVSSTIDDVPVLFITGSNILESTPFLVERNGDVIWKGMCAPNQTTWKTLPKETTEYTIKLGNEKQTISVDKTKVYNDVVFKFSDNKLVCKDWYGLPEEDGFSDRYKARSNNRKVLSAKIHFLDGPFVEVVGDVDKEYVVEFYADERLVYNVKVNTNNWAKANDKYFRNWHIQVWDGQNLAFEHKFDASNKNVVISLGSSALGDTIAWVPYAEEFAKKHNCKVYLSTFHNELFEKEYPNITWVKPGQTVDNVYAMYEVGYFDEADKRPSDPRPLPLQQIATDILGLEHIEIRPRISIPKDVLPPVDGKYVCIGMQSTAQAKYWNYPGGWDIVTDHLIDKGYRVLDIDLHHAFGTPAHTNTIPKRAIDMTGSYTLQERISQLIGAEFFIGLGSGLSWLAWALGIPVILISGFSHPDSEFKTNVIRIHDNDGCNSCFSNPKHTFDRSDWAWCPEKQNFDCTKRISPERVIRSISYQRLDRSNLEDGGDFWLKEEQLEHESYNKEYRPKDGDVVVDIGASIGVYAALNLQDINLKKCYYVEPLSFNLKTLRNNIQEFFPNNPNHIVVDSAISEETGTEQIAGDSTWSPELMRYKDSDATPGEIVKTLSFIDFMTNCEIDHIDMLKMDCEGGEYSIFLNDKNMELLSKTTKHMTGELHIHIEPHKGAFMHMLNQLDRYGFQYWVSSIDGFDIKDNLLQNRFLEDKQLHSLDFYRQVIFHAKNKSLK